MYHRYKFPICLRYADFDLMPTIHLINVNKDGILINQILLELSLNFCAAYKVAFKCVNYLFCQEQIIRFLFKIMYHFPVILPFHKMWIGRLTEEEKV